MLGTLSDLGPVGLRVLLPCVDGFILSRHNLNIWSLKVPCTRGQVCEVNKLEDHVLVIAVAVELLVRWPVLQIVEHVIKQSIRADPFHLLVPSSSRLESAELLDTVLGDLKLAVVV